MGNATTWNKSRQILIYVFKSETDDDFERQDNRMNHDISYPFPISAPIPTNFTENQNRMSLLRSSEDETTSDSDHHNHHHHHHQMNDKGKGHLNLIFEKCFFT